METIERHQAIKQWRAMCSNLVTNALKYGEGKPIDIAVTSEGANAVLRVRDRGIGIEPAKLERIFGRFERAVSARQYGGFGLRLYIAGKSWKR